MIPINLYNRSKLIWEKYLDVKAKRVEEESKKVPNLLKRNKHKQKNLSHQAINKILSDCPP